MAFHIALIDDNIEEMQLLKIILEKEFAAAGFESVVFAEFASGEEFLQQFTPKAFGLIFLDIYMKEKNGIETAEKIRSMQDDTAIVLCTTSRDFAAQSYDVNASYYLCKPLTEERVHRMMQKIDPVQLLYSQEVMLPDGKPCRLEDIVYTSYNNHRISVYMASGSLRSFKSTQKELADILLRHKDFHEINQGSIVNFKHVTAIQNKSASVDTGEILPISRGRYKLILLEFEKYLFRTLQ